MADQCRSCQAPVMWLENATTGKRAPIDREPASDGNVVLLDAGHYQVLGKTDFATCAQARSWQGGQRAVREESR